MTTTDKLKLKKPDKTDTYNVEDFNYNTQRLDDLYGEASGIATLNEEGIVPSSQLPTIPDSYSKEETDSKYIQETRLSVDRIEDLETLDLTKYPNGCLVSCKEDGLVYQYNKLNSFISLYGKFRVFSSGSVSTPSVFCGNMNEDSILPIIRPNTDDDKSLKNGDFLLVDSSANVPFTLYGKTISENPIDYSVYFSNKSDIAFFVVDHWSTGKENTGSGSSSSDAISVTSNESLDKLATTQKKVNIQFVEKFKNIDCGSF